MDKKETVFSILLVDDEPEISMSVKRCLRKEPYSIKTRDRGMKALELMDIVKFNLYIIDIKMPGMDGITLLKKIKDKDPESTILVLSGTANISIAIEAIKLGAADFIEKPFHPEGLRSRIRQIYKLYLLENENKRLHHDLDSNYKYKQFIGNSPATLALKEMISRVAPSQESVLILGDSGTGKELVARSLHDQSTRAGKLFLPVDCAGISKDLIESELFGHEKGAFTGAAAPYPGLIRSADKGTLFLDEIGELPLNTQAKLLRFLQEKTVRPIGSTKALTVDVRIIAATNRNLSEEVEKKTFREDLFYRLNVIGLKAPSLRNRREDIPLLSRFFLDKFSSEASPVKTISPDAQKILADYNWPGNVRELENCIRRTIAMGINESILPADLPEEIFISAENQNSRDYSLESAEKTAFSRALIISGGNRAKAADILGIGVATLYRKLNKYKLRLSGNPVIH